MDFVVYSRSRDSFKRVFVNSLVKEGITELCSNALFDNPKIVTILAKIGDYFSLPLLRNKHALLVPSNGYLLYRECLPYSFTHEVIPFLWDCWPGSWSYLDYSFLKLKVRLCFVTSKQIQNIFQKRFPDIKFEYIPEAVNSALFDKGNDLETRKYKLFEIGRKHPKYTSILESYFEDKDGYINHYVEDFYKTLSNTQITVSFPRCDTNPDMAGNIETLTERYWESMFSRNLIIGRAPQELKDLIGYNPVIEIDWSNPKEQLNFIYNNLASYQSLVDKNYESACLLGSWEKRFSIIKDAILELM